MIDVNTASVEDIERVQRQLAEVITQVGDGDGLEGLLTLATMQALRFVLAHIEVDTGRTKNSVFPTVKGGEAKLATNVSYAPFVRDAGHSEQFFRYADRVEGPRIQESFGLEVQARVNRAFT
ncbi:MAG: hypothetical protein IPM39_29525 [Chloroflexi bacterium]|nr:hypothetical protein [Chloroflexota bacterium]